MTNTSECRVAGERGAPGPCSNDRRRVNGRQRSRHHVRSCKVETSAGLQERPSDTVNFAVLEPPIPMW